MSSDGQIVEEKIVKVNGDVAIKRYSKAGDSGKAPRQDSPNKSSSSSKVNERDKDPSFPAPHKHRPI